jgi:hypothetical protein
VIFQFLVPVRRISRNVEHRRHHPVFESDLYMAWRHGVRDSMTTAKTDEPATARLISHADLVVVCRYVADWPKCPNQRWGVQPRPKLSRLSPEDNALVSFRGENGCLDRAAKEAIGLSDLQRRF